MAQTTIFLDTFTGPSGLAISARSPETGSWVGSTGDSDYVKLDGAGFAHYPGAYYDSEYESAYFTLYFDAQEGSGALSMSLSVQSPTIPIGGLICGFALLFGVTSDDHGVIVDVLDDGGGNGRLSVRVQSSATEESLEFPLIAGEEFTVGIQINAGVSAMHMVYASGSGWYESVSVQGEDEDYRSLPFNIPLDILDNSRTKIGLLSVAADQDGEDPVGGQYTVDGASTTMYGQPRMTHAVAGAESTRYGAILAKYDVSARVAPQEPSTRSGTPLAWLLAVDAVGTIHGAYGACTTGAGIPRAGHPQIGEVHGASTTESGSPTSRVRVMPEAAHTTMAGHPGATVRVSVGGVCGTKYGTPASNIAHAVSGSCLTKYGKPKVSFPDGHKVYGLNNGRRAGVPRAAEIT